MSGNLRRTRILDLENQSWDEGPTFPVQFERGSTVQLPATFNVVTDVIDDYDDYDDNNNNNAVADVNVVVFDADGNDWIVLETDFVSQSSDGFHRMPNAFLVPESYFEC